MIDNKSRHDQPTESFTRFMISCVAMCDKENSLVHRSNATLHIALIIVGVLNATSSIVGGRVFASSSAQHRRMGSILAAAIRPLEWLVLKCPVTGVHAEMLARHRRVYSSWFCVTTTMDVTSMMLHAMC